MTILCTFPSASMPKASASVNFLQVPSLAFCCHWDLIYIMIPCAWRCQSSIWPLCLLPPLHSFFTPGQLLFHLLKLSMSPTLNAFSNPVTHHIIDVTRPQVTVSENTNGESEKQINTWGNNNLALWRMSSKITQDLIQATGFGRSLNQRCKWCISEFTFCFCSSLCSEPGPHHLPYLLPQPSAPSSSPS